MALRVILKRYTDGPEGYLQIPLDFIYEHFRFLCDNKVIKDNYFEIHQKEVWSNWNYPGETKKYSLLKGLY